MKKDVKPELLYGDYNAEPFNFIPVVCPICNREVPYTQYCCECGQKFILPKDEDEGKIVERHVRKANNNLFLKYK